MEGAAATEAKGESAQGGAADALCAYEKERLANIARNQKVLVMLGLAQDDVIAHHELRDADRPKKRAKRDSASSAEELRASVRRSQRLAGLPACDESAQLSSPDGVFAAKAAHAEAHDAARLEYEAAWTERWSGKQKGPTIVGTASYAHTLMRVMTMSEAALANRIKAIERSCGQHAVAKMKLFATILTLEGYVELAEDAASAYERLVEQLGEPSAVASETTGARVEE